MAAAAAAAIARSTACTIDASAANAGCGGAGCGGGAAGVDGILSTPSLGAGNSAESGTNISGLVGGGGGGGYGGGGGGGGAGGAGADGAVFLFIATVTTRIPCFLRGSRILCLEFGKEKYIPIEKIKVGTPVKTLDGTYINVHSIGCAPFKNPDNADIGPNRLFKLTPAKYPELTEDLILTGCHSTLVDRITKKEEAECMRLMKTLYLTSGKVRLMAFIDEKSEPYINPGEHEVWHLALENDNPVCNYGIYANGLLVETASIKNMRERCGLVLIDN
jgi:hypothetical protein